MLVANWKMNGSSALVNKWIEGVNSSIPEQIQSRCVFCPPTCFLYQASNLIKERDLKISLGAQDIDPISKTGLTGGISGFMLKELGCKYVIIGHSERRMNYKERNSLLIKKLLAAASEDLKIIFCIGESLQEKDAGKTYNTLKKQLEVISKVENAKLIIAYEPVWAIGSNNPAEPAYIEEVHNGISEELKSLKINELLGIMYGGSVKMDSAKQILSLNNVDGLLIGGASLNEAEFSNIALSSSA